VDKSALLNIVRSQVGPKSRSPFLISYANAHCLNMTARDAAFQAALNEFDLIYADGIGAVWASWIFGGCRLHKLTGADWIHDFAGMAQSAGWRIFILAGRPGAAEQARENLIAAYPGLEIVGAHDGYFEESEEAGVLQAIQAAGPDILFVGMGVPRQEKWILNHQSELPVKICWAVGALFDYVAGLEQRAPAWMRALALEWLWRMLVDPSGKWRRYLVGNPMFLTRVLVNKIQSTIARD
jgi:N-acetylglucosaminyldiphosphoundecaprenol N-acetyl-beta-D-mannosaminyltransferase